MSGDIFNLTGKTALVTGGSRGIGAACANLLTTRGASVAITYSRSAERAEALVAETGYAAARFVQGLSLAPSSTAQPAKTPCAAWV